MVLDAKTRVAIIVIMATIVKTHVMMVPAREAKNRFGELLEAVQRHPIVITRNNRPVAKLHRFSEKTRFEEMEDQIWGERALKAEKEGSLSVEETKKFMELLRRKHARPPSR
jgi:prevent-host-death family protein